MRTNIVTFIGAGHETTANALSWSLYLLSQDERARERVEQEVDEVLGRGRSSRSIWSGSSTRVVIDEAVRLYPPAPYMSRTAIADDRIGDLEIPAGSMVVIAPYVLHRHKKLWDEPDAFRPAFPAGEPRRDRPLRLSAVRSRPRVCIGASFSLQEAVIVLATIARSVRLDLVEGHEVVPVQRITLRPRGGLPMRLTQRARKEAPAAA